MNVSSAGAPAAGGSSRDAVVTTTGLGWRSCRRRLTPFDFPAIMAVTVIITLGFVVVNLAVDLIYPIVDPRIRLA